LTIAVPIAPLAAVALQQFVDETAGLETVQLPDPDAEPILCEGFDVAFIQLVLANDLLHQLTLLGRAGPGAGVGPVAIAGGVHPVGRGIGQEALKRGYLEKDPFDGIKIRKESPEEKPPFSDEQIQQIREALKTQPEWMSFAFEIAIHHGVRLRETATDTKNINLKRNTVHFNYQKNGEPFTVKIAPGVRPLLEKLVARRGNRLFEIPENDSKPFSNLFKELGMAKENYCFHCTRVTVITRMALADVPIAKAMRYVNHASEEIHRIYAKIRGEDVDGCSEAIAIPAPGNP